MKGINTVFRVRPMALLVLEGKTREAGITGKAGMNLVDQSLSFKL